MSRSRRKTPIMCHSSSISEKEDKENWHRAFRRYWNQLLSSTNLEDEIFLEKDLPYPHIHSHSDPWGMDKDGKVYCHELEDKDMRK